MKQVQAQAPGKVILFGEHAINRGQPALAAAVGIYARCRVTEGEGYSFRAGDRHATASRGELFELRREVDRMRSTEACDQIRALARGDYFAPQKYILATMFDDSLPAGLSLEWESEIPLSAGLGSGGAAFTAMVAALRAWIPFDPQFLQLAEWARLGDVIAHGGIASGLDTQASLLGGVICFHGTDLAERVACAPGANLVVANTGVMAATSEVNSRVRRWLAERPDSRMHYFQMIGALSRAAGPLLRRGNWDELGRLMSLNHLVLEKIGVSCPEIDRMVEAALAAGAFGAKISGSGGGGIVIVLCPAERQPLIIESIQAAGGTVQTPPLGVPGATAHLKEEAFVS
jgi:mevalonate kinase